MTQKRKWLLLPLLFISFLLSGADLKISWREGKDNRCSYPATITVSLPDGKPAAFATLYSSNNLIGQTDNKGVFRSDSLNNAAVKLALKACLNDLCSDKIIYQVLPSDVPYPVFLSMGADPATEISLTWHTAEKAIDGMAECVPEKDPAGFLSKEVIRVQASNSKATLVDIDKEEGKKYNVAIHRATISGLMPDSKYKYRVGDGKKWAKGTFTTAPASAASTVVKFLFTADSQESTRENYQANLKNVLQQAFQGNPDIRFIAHAGDMVNRGMNAQEWSWFYEAGRKYFANYALAPVPGNHETGGVVIKAPQEKAKAYLNFFNNPSNHTGLYAEGSAYSFDYGPVHLLCLDIQNLFDAMETAEKTGDKKYLQSAIDWITTDLVKAASRKKWKVITMHQPIFGANRDETELRQVLAPVFEKAGADLVISGHDHYYFRSFPLRYDSQRNDGEVVPLNGVGITYLIGGSTCTKFYVQKFARPYQAVVLSKELFPGKYPWTRNEVLIEQNYSIFTVSEKQLLFQFFDKNGSLRDELKKEK